MDISTFFIVINFLFLFSYSLYFWTNSEILSDDEIKELSNSQRFWDLQNYFSFTKGQFIVDKKFKSGLNTKGQFYFCNEPLNNFPAIASALLKGKKHEWVIFAFVKNKNVFSFYINKGDDNQSVTPNISPEFIRKFAKDNNSEIILEFHNHPNAILGASKQDIISANYFGTLFAEYEINY